MFSVFYFIFLFYFKGVLVLEDPIDSTAILGYVYRQQQHHILAVADEIMELEVIDDVRLFYFILF